MKSSSNLIVLFQARAATENFGQPELPNCALHVADLALGRRRCLDPLRRLAANAAYHVSMGEGLGGPLLRFHIES